MKPENTHPHKSYILDRANRFVWFSAGWDADVHTRYEGREFFELLEGPHIRHVYQTLFQTLRTHWTQDFPLSLRCDSSECKIWIEADFRKLDKDSLQTTLHFVRVEKHDLASDAAPCDCLKMCSFCQSLFDFEQRKWIPFDEALGHLAILQNLPVPSLTHACCPACAQNIRGQIHAYTCGR